MIEILANRTYRQLFLAQLVALLGTGLATMALGLMAFDLSGQNAGAVLGMLFTIKMIAYVFVSPIAGALATRVSRRKYLVVLDIVRAIAAICLLFVSEVWQVFVLIGFLQMASAAFIPVFQATIPDVLPDEAEYTKALSMSRIAYDLENIVSPLLAALILSFASYQSLFVGTCIGFVASAVLIASTVVPVPAGSLRSGVVNDMSKGIRIFLATPRLRGLMLINLAIAVTGAMVLVNTVVLVQGKFGLGESHTVFSMAIFGGGSVMATLILPRVLDRYPDRKVVLIGACLLALSISLVGLSQSFNTLLAIWFAAGIGYAMAQLPAGRLLRRSAHESDRTALFSAQFALSHACWLVGYPLAGFLGLSFGLPAAALILSAIAICATWSAWMLWPGGEIRDLPHDHPDLPVDHPHLREGTKLGTHSHQHKVIIDPLHPQWPSLR